MNAAISQKTISKEGQISGIGLHTGEPCTLYVKPAPAGTGIQFSKNGKNLGALEICGNQEESLRCSAIGNGHSRILTVEHVLAALSGMGIRNIRIDVHGPEIPGLDGSALDFVRFFKGLGVSAEREVPSVYHIEEPIFCSEEKKAIAVLPNPEFSVAYTLDYNLPGLELQTAQFLITPDVFEKEIAPARTFCTEEEAHYLKNQGFGKGADYKNTLVFSKNGVIQNKLRFKDEAARHKILDLIGDLALLGFPICGKVIGIKSGHSLNRKLVQEIKKQRDFYGKRN